VKKHFGGESEERLKQALAVKRRARTKLEPEQVFVRWRVAELDRFCSTDDPDEVRQAKAKAWDHHLSQGKVNETHRLDAWLVYELMIGNGDSGGAVSFLEGTLFANRAGLLEAVIAGTGKGKGFYWARHVVRLWQKQVARQAAREMKQEWMRDGIPQVDMAVFAQSQLLGVKAKGHRRKKPGKAANRKEVPRARKDQGGAATK